MASVAPMKTMVFDQEQETSATISAVHSDILLTHILTRLDGPDLASTSCASSHLRLISNHQSLWSNICYSTWPSTNTPRMRHLISTYPNGPRSFFSDSFPLLQAASTSDHGQPQPQPTPDLIISAVDLHYKNNCIFSKVLESETLSSWFRCSPFRIDLLDPKDVVPTPIQSGSFTCEDLEENLTLSWIAVDPTGRRAANVSSRRAVSVQQHWLSGEIQLRFATVMAGAADRGSTELVQCGAVITCGRCDGSREKKKRIQVIIREVSLQLEDMDGMNLKGKESLVILQRAMSCGQRKRARRGFEEGREKYEKFLKKKEERAKKKLRREGMLDTMCKAVGVTVLLAAFCTLSLFFCLRFDMGL